MVTDFVERISKIDTEVVKFEFLSLVNEMARESIGLQYMGLKKNFLLKGVWNQMQSTDSFDGIGLAIFSKFSVKKRFCLQMLNFGLVDWVLHRVATLTSETYEELQHGLPLIMNLAFIKKGQFLLA